MIAFALSLSTSRSAHKRIDIFTGFAYNELSDKQLEVYITCVYLINYKIHEDEEADLKKKRYTHTLSLSL